MRIGVSGASGQLRGGLEQAGLPPFIIDAVASVRTSFVEGAYDVVTGDIEHLTGRAPRSLRDVLSQVGA